MNMHYFLKACLLLTIIAAPAVAHASGEAVGTGITPGRLGALIPGVAGLVSVIIGGLALRSSAGIHFRKRGAITALVGGMVCVVLSVMHLARTTGGFGTGSGKLGAIVALVLGVTGMILGGMALARSKRMP